MTLRNARGFVLPATLVLTVVLPVAAPYDASPTVSQRAAAPAAVGALAPMTAAVIAAHLPAPPAAAAVPVRLPKPPTIAIPAAPSAVRAPRAPVRRATRAVSSGRGWEQQRGAAALQLISYPWQELGWTISFHPARRGLLGVAYEPERHIYVFVRRNQSLASLAFTVAHEIGHAYDFNYGTRESHARWLQLRGIDPATPWTGCDGCADLATPAGDFAEVFALWQLGPADFRSEIAPLPDAEQLSVLSREFWDAEAAGATQ